MEIHCKFYFPQLSVFQLWIEFIFANQFCLTISYIEQYKEALEVRIFPKRTLPVIKRLHPVSFQQSKDVLLLI